MKKNSRAKMIPLKHVENIIYFIRDQRVILDRDLASLYGVQTKALNQAVKRNLERFPEDFMFQLTQQEFENWKSQIVTSNSGEKMSLRKRPLAFTEYGAIMVANLLRSPQAISVSIQVVRAFIQLRQMTHSHAQLIKKVDSMQAFMLKNAQSTTQEFRKVWSAIEKLMLAEPLQEKRKIGFRLEDYQD